MEGAGRGHTTPPPPPVENSHLQLQPVSSLFQSASKQEDVTTESTKRPTAHGDQRSVLNRMCVAIKLTGSLVVHWLAVYIARYPRCIVLQCTT